MAPAWPSALSADGAGPRLRCARYSRLLTNTGRTPRQSPMWQLLVWIVVALLLALWSAACALLHGLLLALTRAPADDWLRRLEQWQIPLWLADWLPLSAISAFKAWLTQAMAELAPLLTAWPSVLDWLAPLLWASWAVGAAAVLLSGLVASVAVAAISRHGRPAAAGTARAATASARSAAGARRCPAPGRLPTECHKK